MEQRSPQLGYLLAFNTCSHAKRLLMNNLEGVKIVHERAFYMGTCTEGGDGFQPRSPTISRQICKLGEPITQITCVRGVF